MIIDKGKLIPYIDLETTNKVSKSVCKILIKQNEGTQAGTGFFYYIKIKNRYNKHLKEPTDISIIEIKSTDEFINYIEFLDYDLNYIKDYSQYKNLNVTFIINQFLY